MISEPQVRTAVVGIISGQVPDAKVYRRLRYPAKGQEASYRALYVGTAGYIHYYGVRRLQLRVEIKGDPGRLIAITYVYGVRVYRSLLDNPNDVEASEELFQAELDGVCSAVNSFPYDLGLGVENGVNHTGLQMPTDFVDVQFGTFKCHRVDLRLEVRVRNL
jgi:hypothetical protein